MPPDYFKPDHFKFGGGAADTVLHPVVLVAMLVAIILMLALPRKYVVIPFLLVAFLTPLGQEVMIGGMHVFVLRILILAGCGRMLWTKLHSSGEILSGGYTPLDSAFLAWAIFRAITFVLLFLDPAAMVNRFGFLWDALGGFFLLRFLIRDQKDVQRVLKCFAVITVILAGCMINEQVTRHNIFADLGGVRNVVEIRDGRVRSQAAFQHPLLAGAFGGTMFPLFIVLWTLGKDKFLSLLGMISCVVMVLASATSTSIMSLAAGVLGLMFWPLRKRMRAVRWTLVGGVLALHLAMHAPVWYLISHVDLTGGSSSYHRAVLVDHFIRNFGDWWLLGTNSNADWGADMWDTCNQYVQEGQDGGLATFACFLALIVIGFRWIGQARRAVQGDRKKELYYWLLGSAMFSNVIGFFGISYFDQTRDAWFAFLSMIAAATLVYRQPRSVQAIPKLADEHVPAVAAEPYLEHPIAPRESWFTQ